MGVLNNTINKLCLTQRVDALAEVTFRLSEEQGNVEICIHDFAPPLLKEPDVKRLFSMSEFRECHFYPDNVTDVLAVMPEKLDLENAPETFDEPMCFVIAQMRDAVLEIEMDDAGMEISAHCTTQEGGEGILLESIVKKLKELGAVKGIDKDAIRAFHDRAQKERPGISFAEVIAKGKPTGAGTESSFEYLVTPLQDRVLTPQKREDGTLDMHELGDIDSVEQGDLLMRRIPAQAGENGYTVRGEALVSIASDNVPFDVGDGTTTSPDDANLLIATRKGIPLKSKNGISVSEMLVLKNVDLTTGNVEYDGSVMVSGNVKGGMLVKATKDVIINGFVESGMVEAGGNIVVQQGVIGREIDEDSDLDKDHYTSKLIAKNDISARYAQSAYMEAGRDIEVVSQLLHCHVIADHGVYVGGKGQKKSKLVGGIIKVGKEVSSGEIGSPSNAPMVLDFSHRLLAITDELRAVRKENIVKKELIQGLRDALEELKAQKPTPELIRHCKKIVNTISIVKEELVSINLNEQSLNMTLNKLRDGIRVTVYGRLYPGVEITVCDQGYSVVEERGNSVVRFNDANMVFE